METFLVVFFIISILILLALGIWFAIVFYQKSEEDVMKGAFCVNLLSQKCGNYAYGIEKEVKVGIKGRMRVVYSPLDIDVKKLGKTEDQVVLLDRGKRIIFPLGDFSGEKNIVLYLPPDITHLPKTIRDSEFSNFILEKIEEVNMTNKEVELFKNRLEVIEELASETIGNELVRKRIITNEELFKDLVKKMLKDKDERRPIGGGYLPPSSPSSNY